MKAVIFAAAFAVFGPFFGGFVAGLDRVLSARLQSRKGPPVLQPFYDVIKLMAKENLIVTNFQMFYLICFLFFVIFTGVLFFSGGDLLIVIFALTLAGIFFVLSGYSANSPYSHIGANRELIQMMSYEPIVILSAVGMYMITGSFRVTDILASERMPILYLPGVFLAFVYVLTIKLRKSPFDLAVSHHAHQEIVKGLVTDFSGRPLALVEIAHWYETAILVGFLILFFGSLPLLGGAVAVAVYLLEIVLDNSEARVKWQAMIKSSWWVTLAAGVVNILVLAAFRNSL